MVDTQNLTTTLVATSTASYQEPRPESTFWRFSGPLTRQTNERTVQKTAASGQRRWPVETTGTAPLRVSPNGAIPRDEAEVGELEIGDLTYHALNSTTRRPGLRIVDWSRIVQTVELNSTGMVKYPALPSPSCSFVQQHSLFLLHSL
ncbi:hypothetical protein N8T08_003330 [Aspergillus melleus]|uniref:Uncharacterized protein n=1 Tax=Aspergillus melleus TaxID=138277 RepID=A0ACC3B759_9EURO|nr:hypothetical protein N8T08_003330 [Aspergillus melleus]